MGRRKIQGGALRALAAALVLTACGSPTPPGSPGTPGSPEPTAHPGAASGGDVARPPEIPEDAWAAVLADLEARTGGRAEAVTVVTAEAVTWNDGSLGCPEPGKAYTQALVDGYHVVLDAGGEEFDYRVGGSTAVKLCTTR